MSCPHCGARNTPDAPWCTQCLQPLGQDPPPTQATAPAPPMSAPAPAPPPAAARPAAGGGADGAFRSVDGQVQWRCTACDTWNALEVHTCRVCGTPLASSVTGTRAAEVTGRVSRARRVLWVVAAIGGTVAIVSIVLLVLALRGGVAG